jgi:hypothetical protein
MTEQQHPINPPLDLIKTWMIEYYGGEIPGGFAGDEVYLCKCAAQWGSDQELEACCAFAESQPWGLVNGPHVADVIRAARRPKPPSLKEQALAELAEWENVMDIAPDSPIRRALEQLDD